MPFLGDTDSHSYLILTVSKFFLKQVLLTIGVHLARTNAAVHWCWVTAPLSKQQIFIGAVAVTQSVPNSKAKGGRPASREDNDTMRQQ